jgi:hypothetical protein
MQAVPQPHENWKSMLLTGRVDLRHVEQFATILGMMHRRSMEAADDVREVFGDRSFFESLRVEPYYAYTAELVPEAAPFLHDLIRDTRARQLTLVHGDYSPKNILVRDGRLVLLDHEVIHWGDPAFDVGFAITHLLSKAIHLPQCRAELRKAVAAFYVDYDAARGMPFGNSAEEPMVVRHSLGCLLARVAGRSPLEYLTQAERARQRKKVVELMRSGVEDLPTLIVDLTLNPENDADAQDQSY